MSEAKQDQPEVMSADEIAALEAKLSMGDPPARKRSTPPPASAEPANGTAVAEDAKADEPKAKTEVAAGDAQPEPEPKRDAAPESADPVSMRELEATTDYTPPPAGVVPAGPVSVREFLDPDDDDAEPLSLRDLERVFTPGAQPPPIGARRPPSAPPPPLPPPRRPSAPPPPLGTVTGMLDRLTKEHAEPRDEAEGEPEIERGPDSGAEDLKRLASLRPDKKPDLEFEELMQMHVTPFVNVPGTPKLPSDLLHMRGGDAVEKPRPRPPLKSRAPEAPASEAKKPVDADFDEGLVPPSFREPVVEAAPSSVGPQSTGPRSKKSKRKKGEGAKADGSKEKASRSLEKAAAAIASADDEDAPEKSIAPTSTSKPSVVKAKPAPEPAEKSSKMPLYALLAAGLLGAGYFLGRGDDAPKPTAPTTVATTAAVPTTPAPTQTITAPAPTETAPAAPTTSAAPADTAAASAAPTATGDAPTAPTATTATPATTATGATATPTTTTAAAPATATPTAEPATPPPAPTEGAAFDKGAASAALAAAVGQASGCKQEGDPSGSARVQVTFAPSGRVTVANVMGPPFAGTATGGCIARTFRSASVPPFSGDPVTVSKTVSIP